MKLAAIVISYNRPKMIREALASLKGADEVIIVDDGSDFDVQSLLKEFSFGRFEIVSEPPVTAQVRAVEPRMGKLINKALKKVQSDLVTYLCDDDLLAENWIEIAKDFFEKYKQYHIVKGISRNVRDIDNLADTEETRMDERQLVTGNFVHRFGCFKKEGIKWPEDRIVNADHEFLTTLDLRHRMSKVPRIEVMACYRRIHEGNLSNFIGENFSEEKVKQLLQRKWME